MKIHLQASSEAGGNSGKHWQHQREWKMNLIRPRLVTFDVTGTLLMTALEVHYTEIGLLYGLSVDSRKLAASFKKNFTKLTADHPIYGKHTGLGWENWWRKIVFNVFKEQNKNSCDKALDKIADSLIECYGTNKCWHKYPDTTKILDYLKERGVIMGVISNFDARLESVLISTELRPYFSFVLASYNLGSEKPDPSIFEEALKMTKQHCDVPIQPHEAVHIGDTYDKDYIGAKNARWNAILIARDAVAKNRLIEKANVPSENIFHSLNDLRIHFDKVLPLPEGNS